MRNAFVAKSSGCHEKYYPTTAKKTAALQDDRYVYPGDPVRAWLKTPWDVDVQLTPNTGYSRQFQPPLPESADSGHPEKHSLQWSGYPPKTLSP